MAITIDERLRSHIPPLRADELRQLEENILRDGCKTPLVVWNGVLVDGHNRFDICTRHGLPFSTEQVQFADFESAVVWIEENQLGRRNLTADQFAYFIGRKYERAKRRAGRPEKCDQNDHVSNGRTEEIVGAQHGISGPTVRRAADFAADVDQIAQEIGDSARGELLSGGSGLTRKDVSELAGSLSEARQEGLHFASAKDAHEWVKQERAKKAEARRSERVEKLAEISRGNGELSADRQYPIIYADPPWRYEHPPMGGNRIIENHYPTMTLEEICALPVADLATPDAVLFMWATTPKLAECFDVLKAWGFDYRTCAAWIKDKIGMGYYVRNQHELLLIAKRGEPPMPHESARQSSVIHAPRTEHSAKPVEFYELIERMYPELPKIELFARNVRDGWAAWGNQAEAA